METTIIIFALIFVVMFFKSSIKRVSKHTENVIITEINESQQDLIRRSTEAYNSIVEEFGEDFETPSQIFDKLSRRKYGRPGTFNSPNNK